jgi:hypothetical protein
MSNNPQNARYIQAIKDNDTVVLQELLSTYTLISILHVLEEGASKCYTKGLMFLIEGLPEKINQSTKDDFICFCIIKTWDSKSNIDKIRLTLQELIARATNQSIVIAKCLRVGMARVSDKITRGEECFHELIPLQRVYEPNKIPSPTSQQNLNSSERKRGL